MRKILPFILALMLGSVAIAQTPVQVFDPDDEPVFTVVDNEPEFPGGMENLYQYIATNVQYPAKAKTDKIAGRVFISFVIEKDGSISNIKTLHCPDESLCQEAVRVVKAMPKWKPGRVKGKKVRVQFTLPINFQLD